MRLKAFFTLILLQAISIILVDSIAQQNNQSSPLSSNNYIQQNSIHLVENISLIKYSKKGELLIVVSSANPNTFLIYDGIKTILKQQITIVDKNRTGVNISALSFSYNDGYLAIATSEGAIYNYQIVNWLIEQPYAHLFYTNATVEERILTIDYSPSNQIAIAIESQGKYQRVDFLQVPSNGSSLQLLFEYQTDQPITSAFWSPNDSQIIGIGCIFTNPTGVQFLLVLLTMSNYSTVSKVSNKNTTTLAFSPNGQYLFQGSPDSDVSVYAYSDVNATPLTTIPNTRGVVDIMITQDEQLIALVIQYGNSSSVQIKRIMPSSSSSPSSLPSFSSSPQSLSSAPANLTFTDVMSLDGDNFAMTSNGQFLLMPNQTLPQSNVDVFSLCDLNYTMVSSQCVKCNANCQNGCLIGNPNTCICTSSTYFNPNTNVCLSCATSLIGCQACNNEGNSCSECDSSQFWHLSTLSAALGTCTCYSNNFRTLNQNKTQCICLNGYFQSSPSQQLCSSCTLASAGCVSCQNNTVCEQCASTFILVLSSKKCQCPSQDYLSTNKSMCIQCNSTIEFCSACTNLPSQGLICQQCALGYTPTTSTSSINQCQCVNGQINQETLACQQIINHPSSLSWKIIVGIVCGSVVLIIVIVILALIWRRKKIRNNILMQQMNHEETYKTFNN